ncbi:hypothetical protein ASF76_02735 [Microbacterium sp. Leaf151]|nr:hypothetical protein ASF76_02735 [Microbacterium sp. Leaf151]
MKTANCGARPVRLRGGSDEVVGLGRGHVPIEKDTVEQIQVVEIERAVVDGVGRHVRVQPFENRSWGRVGVRARQPGRRVERLVRPLT